MHGYIWTLLFLAVHVAFVYTLIEPVPTPKDLIGCYDFKTKNVSEEDVPGKRILDMCLRTYLLHNHIYAASGIYNLSDSGKRYLDSLFRELEGEMYEINKEIKHSKRSKRQTEHGLHQRTWRHRKEIRTLTPYEWNRVTNALNRLKRDYSVDPSISVYDMISFLHSGRILEQAHGGPNFFGFHTIYLLIMETAMRVPIPYWDSTLDHAMTDPTLSVLWTDMFFGNGNGEVREGPFAAWRTRLGTGIIRNIGSGTDTLMTKHGIRMVLSRLRTADISEPLSGSRQHYSFEGYHNGPHNWVDGYFGYLQTSTYDPIFFFHHSFTQLIWLEFKRKQRRNGIIPEQDYPRGANVPNAHRWYRHMDFLPFSGHTRHIDGYSRRYDNMVHYSPMPRCSDRCGYSPHLHCDERRNICVSRAGAVNSRGNGIPFGHLVNFMGRRFRPSPTRQTMMPTLPAPSAGHRPELPPLTRRFQIRPALRDPAFSSVGISFHPRRRKRNSKFQICPSCDPKLECSNTTQSCEPRSKKDIFPGKTEKRIYHGDIVAGTEENNTSIQSNLKQSYQNTYMINNQGGIKLWVFFPVTIIYEKPKSENSKVFINSHHEINNLYEHSFTCPNATKIYVQSDGLNYLGKYKDFIVVNNTQLISVVTTYIGVKKPESELDSIVILTAYDSCGHACRAMCRVRNSYPVRYEFCSGALKISTSNPMMYSSSINDAIEQWNEVRKGVFEKRKHSAITFICDFQNKWPWQI